MTLLMSDSFMANPESGPHYLVFITKYFFFFNLTYPVRYFRVPPWVCVPQVEDHYFRRSDVFLSCITSIAA
jgi:hypothetical protein